MLHIPMYKIVLYCSIFESGTFQIIRGDGIHLSQSSACRYIRYVALGLQPIYSTFISMPGSTEKAIIKSQFYEIAENPGMLDS